MRIAANLSLLFSELPLLHRVQAAVAAGFSGVEVQFPYEQPAMLWHEALQRAGVPLVLFNLPAGDLLQGGRGLAAQPDCREAFAEGLQLALRYAALLRPRAVNVLAGRLVAPLTREVAWQNLVDNLRQTADAFAVLGIKVLVEAINPLDMPGFLINTPEDLLRLLDDVAHSNCLAQLDLYHMARQGLDIPQAIECLAGRIGHVQFADVPGRGAPGTGELDWPTLFALVEQHCPEVWCAAEYRQASADQAQPALWQGWAAQGRGR